MKGIPRLNWQPGLLLPLSLNAALIALWLTLFRPVYPYLATIFTRQEFRTNQVVLLAALGLVIFQVRRGEFRPRPAALPRPYAPALLLAAGGAAAFVLAERWLDINTLSAALFGLATYGLLGLWLRPAYWRRGLPAALIIVGALPFGEHMQTFAGYPLRVATARLVSSGLSAIGAPNLSADTILIFENGISQVDNPCSGVKSLWTGGLFLLAATWIERRPINRRWILAALAFALLLVAANLARVAVLVGVGQALGWRLLAEMLHVPLGVVGFMAACTAGLLLLRWTGTMPDLLPGGEPQSSLQAAHPLSRWLAPGLSILLIALILVYTPVPQPAAASARSWALPASLAAKEWPLSTQEAAWLAQDAVSGDVQGTRWMFDWHGTRGTLLFVLSTDWRAHHRPERCFTVYGLEVKRSRTALAAPDFPMRLLSLGMPDGEASGYAAAYWLQSPSRVTDDYAARIWEDLSPHPEPWVLATVLFDEPVDLQSPQALELFAALRESIQAGLEAR